MKPKIILALNSTWNLINFRLNLVKALVATGYDVTIVAPFDKHTNQLSILNVKFISLSIDKQGTNPIKDFILLLRYWKLLKSEKPAIFLGYTIKPNIYGSLAAHFLNVPVINNITGLGTTFIKQSWITILARYLYRASLTRSVKVFFQNHSDSQLFIEKNLVTLKAIDQLPGSGIDLKKFYFCSDTSKYNIGSSMRFLLIARMLWDKGVKEYVEAARLVHHYHPNVKFSLLGFLDLDNPSAVSKKQIDKWVTEGVVSYLGKTDDVRTDIIKADCVVLPSYREGTSRALLEAAAIGRPIITTNVPGCRNIVDHNMNGYLCEPHNINDLAEKILQMIGLSINKRIKMSYYGRKKIEKEFDEKIVISKYLKTINEIIS